jgi:hypothetical protein
LLLRSDTAFGRLDFKGGEDGDPAPHHVGRYLHAIPTDKVRAARIGDTVADPLASGVL